MGECEVVRWKEGRKTADSDLLVCGIMDFNF